MVQIFSLFLFFFSSGTRLAGLAALAGWLGWLVDWAALAGWLGCAGWLAGWADWLPRLHPRLHAEPGLPIKAVNFELFAKLLYNFRWVPVASKDWCC